MLKDHQVPKTPKGLYFKEKSHSLLILMLRAVSVHVGVCLKAQRMHNMHTNLTIVF